MENKVKVLERQVLEERTRHQGKEKEWIYNQEVLLQRVEDGRVNYEEIHARLTNSDKDLESLVALKQALDLELREYQNRVETLKGQVVSLEEEVRA